METNLRRDREELVEAYGEELLAAQLELEDKMVTLGTEQVRKQIARAREKGNESGTSYGKAIIARSIDTVSEAIVRFLDKAKNAGAGRRHIAVKYLDQIEPDVAAYIALRMVVDSLTGKKVALQSVAVHIGKRIEDEVRFTKFKETSSRMYARALEKAKAGTSYHRKKATMSGYERRFGGEEWTSWPEQDCLHVGSLLIDFILQTELVELGERITARNNTVKVLLPSTKLSQWIEATNSREEILHPAHMPMVVKPLDWTDPFNGGYLTFDAQGRNALVKTGNTNYLTELADHTEEMPAIYEGVNALQSTRWAINTRVLDTINELWERGLPIGKLPDREDIGYCPCPKCGQSIQLPRLNTRGTTEHGCFEDEEVLREWKMKAYELHSANVSSRSKRLHLLKTKGIAETYAKCEAIYFPYQLDFRGRIYAIPAFNPQGNDVTKGLLHFADAKPINDGVAAGWLAIHGANVFGYDKASLEDRIEWVEERTDAIVACAQDPISNRMWCDADKPFQFLAFCFEWAGFMEQGYGFESRLAVALDGSCSGIQHFSAMLRDEEGGRAVNLLPAETPEDIYKRVCDRAIGKLKKLVDELSSTIAQAIASTPTSSPEEESNNYSFNTVAIAEQAKATGWTDGLIAAMWLCLDPNRKTTKRQVMTLPYGATPYSCREYTHEWYRDQINANSGKCFPKEVEFKAVILLSDLIWESITEVVIGARTAMDWLQRCAKVVAAEELPVYWTTPIGFRVMQSYKNHSSRRVKTKLGDAVVKLSLQEEKNTIDKRRMQNAISPNFVHSMDATHLVMSVVYAKENGIDSFALIHDSFGTHAADTQLFSACIRNAFVDLYTEVDVLEDFRQQIIRQVGEEDMSKIPPVPSKGHLDLELIKQSDFAFA